MHTTGILLETSSTPTLTYLHTSSHRLQPLLRRQQSCHGGSELNNLEVTGDISVKPVTKIPGGKVVYIIMGPTGAGKSTFIEALAGGSQNLAISSDQLAGFTQHVTAYKLVNVVRRYTGRVIYLVDTPGFSDDKISEIEVMDMLGDWLEQNW
ncbi:hypothetical protein BJ165DRAFT_1535627 [Panaeolus papilionaceus]|nr:hypothetical protein BJ165DRAFT_1535627 [Panaeolus papilionaceus]